jgi:hypothetical protein
LQDHGIGGFGKISFIAILAGEVREDAKRHGHGAEIGPWPPILDEIAKSLFGFETTNEHIFVFMYFFFFC